MAASFDDFLGAAPAYPFRIGNGGLPDLEFTRGERTIRSVVEFLLLTAPGDLPYDPALGLDPETLRFDPTDLRAAQDAQELVRASLIDAEPRMKDVSADIRADPERNTLDVNVRYGVIDRQVEGNLVVIPQGGHGDVTRVTGSGQEKIVGFHDPKLLGISTG